jgi:hypothetical protein
MFPNRRKGVGWGREVLCNIDLKNEPENKFKNPK